jgi:galactokinase
MTVELPERLDLAPEMRVPCSAYREEFDRSPAVAWQVPGMVTLLADGPLRLTVAAPWGAVAVAGPPYDVIELTRMEQPGEKIRLTVAEAAAGAGPSWAGTGLRAARAGATLLTRTELPEGTGLGAAAATETAIRLCLADAAAPVLHNARPHDSGLHDSGPHAMAGDRRLRFDVRAAGLRLVIIDTRLRDAPRQEPVEHAPLKAAAAAIGAGDLAALGPMLTAVHESLPCHQAQQVAVSAALGAGALGARMITDGPGHPVCALVPAGRVRGLRAAVAAEFARRGLRAPRFLTFTPAGGPRCVRT